MKQIQFKSCLAEPIRKFIQLRCLSGTNYFSQSQLLGYFDDFLVKEKIKAPYVTQQTFSNYIKVISHLSPRSIDNRVCVVRQFCCYLSQEQPNCYLPDIVKVKQSRDTLSSYIFTENQIYHLLKQAKQLPPSKSLRPDTYHAIFGLLYSTGMRIGEALALSIEDLYLEQQRIYIKQGKFRKERWVCLSSSTCLMLEKYLKTKQILSVVSASDSLFVGVKQRSRLQYSAVNKAFSTLLEQCSIKCIPKPRIHDLRHTFAVHRLLKWYREKVDINSNLPALATHMGHVDIYSTQRYLQATPELLKVVSDNFEIFYQQNINTAGEQNES